MNPDAQKITDLLKQTTISYPEWKRRVDRNYYKDVKLTKWWQAFDALSRLPSATPPPSGAPALLGAYKGYANTSGINTFESDHGVTTAVCSDFAGYANWSLVEGGDSFLLGTWESYLGYSSSQPQPLELACTPWPNTGGFSLAAAAAGDYNAHYDALATNLGSYNMDIIVRFAWESTAYWMEWHCGDTAAHQADYVTMFQYAASKLKAQPNLTVTWNPVMGQDTTPGSEVNKVDPANSYPGDAYVDYITTDIYGIGWSNFFNDTKPYDDDWLTSFASTHNKPIAIPEWGLWAVADGGTGDDPDYIDAMADFMRDHCQDGYQSYFDFVGSSDHRLNTYPNARARYEARF